MTTVAFAAYPEGNALVTDAFKGLAEHRLPDGAKVRLWEKLQIAGFKLDNLIRDQVREANVLVADITYPNHNVFYEMGYAIALGKPVLPTVNNAIEKAVERIQQIGLFDTIGWTAYSNSEQLRQLLAGWKAISWANKYVRRRNHEQPLFILDTLKKTDFRNHIFHTVENSKVRFRSFDPAEIPRLTAAQAISAVSASAGVILPILHDDIVDSQRHNLRAAFLLGLCHGYDISALAIQYENAPAPLDYRDFITNSTFRKETENHIENYCAETLIWNQNAVGKAKKADTGVLGRIDLGSPAAEQETYQLAQYFVETAEFSRASRAEGAIVSGRKGSGKSAVLLRVAAEASRNRRNFVVDLRPASHNLSEMREAILGVANAGVFAHTIAAFWQYILYVEVLLKIREEVLPRAKNDFRLQERVRTIEQAFSLDEAVVSGDFTSRLETAVHGVILATSHVVDAHDLRNQLTNAMFEAPIPRLREAIVSFRDFYDEIVILVDDLDKGWPPRQVEAHDVSTVKHLVEALNRVQRDLRRKNVQIKHLVFLRSDIYERLVEQTSDRGKYNIVRIDWSDPEQLRHLLKRRVISAVDADQEEAAWAAFNPQIETGGDAVDRMIEGSLRRPRFLIDLGERILSFAINRGHQEVALEDVQEGLRQMSLYLVSDFGYEMRDIAGTPEDIFYLFIGSSDLLTRGEIENILAGETLSLTVADTIELLMWYGFLGVVTSAGDRVFIYDRAYDFRRLEAELADEENALFAVNPAFLSGLGQQKKSN